jgi:hypothetical protein
MEPQSKAFELGQHLVRLFRGLDALMGSDDEASILGSGCPISISQADHWISFARFGG